MAHSHSNNFSSQIHFSNQFHNFFNQKLQVISFCHRYYIYFILKTLSQNNTKNLFILKFHFRQLFYLFLYFNRCICNLIASSIRVAYILCYHIAIVFFFVWIKSIKSFACNRANSIINNMSLTNE